MSISREDLHTIDFSDIATGEKILPAHPGKILREDFLAPMALSANALAMALHIPAPRVNDIVRGLRRITIDTALRLARYFGTSPEFWINLQTHYDLRMAYAQTRKKIEKEIEPMRA